MSNLNLSKPYAVRLPQAVADRYESIASESNISMSELLRGLFCDDRNITIQQRDPLAKERLAQIMRMHGNAGNNINQIARHLNVLAKKDQMTYQTAIHYLRLLDRIELQFSLAMEAFHAHQG